MRYSSASLQKKTYKETFDTTGSPLCFVSIGKTFDVLFGALIILQSDNGSEFIWIPKVTSVERASSDIKYMLVAWMADIDSEYWPTGIKFIHLQKKQSSLFWDKVLSIFSYVWL
ncbi:KRAB-A domain-containing protein 2-like protein [Plakobranchus ocellatus]|uniref:KRAB-A domain-containing protein 2-like protein n=1 Tax=Plakobranchus ocellatus TaxID=259542 RepID=A0AAV3Y0C2_9GAST|nr:KRAB-A domain-containing protein 2-like protein [Plakobranchus ocellatus]